MSVEKGNIVTAEYEGKFENGEVFDSSSHGDHQHPLEFEVGAGKVIRGFDEAVLGMNEGEEKEFTLEPKEAYGEYNEQMKQTVSKSQLPPVPEGQELKEGMMLGLNTPQGQFPAKIIKVSDSEVTIDLNHPLAGKKLIFKIKIVGIKNNSQ